MKDKMNLRNLFLAGGVICCIIDAVVYHNMICTILLIATVILRIISGILSLISKFADTKMLENYRSLYQRMELVYKERYKLYFTSDFSSEKERFNTYSEIIKNDCDVLIDYGKFMLKNQTFKYNKEQIREIEDIYEKVISTKTEIEGQ